MSDQDTLDAANAYTGDVFKAHTHADDPHAYIDSTHGAGYAQLNDENGNPIGKDLRILGDGDPLPSTATTAVLFVVGAQLGVYVPGDGGIGWVNVVSNPVPLDTTPPTSPSGLTVTNKTATGFTLTWIGSTDVSGIARYETKLGGGAWISNGQLLTRSFSGLVANTAYVVQVRAVDGSAAGNVSSAAQTTVTTATTGGGGGGGTPVTTVMGVNFDTRGSEYDGQWKGLRVYSTGKAATAISQGAKYIAFTDEPGIPMTGGAPSVAKLKTLLDNTYGGPGSPSKNKDVFLAAANGNEVDTNFANGFNNTAYADTMELWRALTDQYDNASTWINITRFRLGKGDSAKLLAVTSTSGKTVGSLLDGISGSYYPPSETSTVYGYPKVLAQMYTDSSDLPPNIVDPFITLAAQYSITRMAIWEVGIPAAINPAPLLSGSPGTTYQDKNARTTWVRNFIEYWMDACVAHGMSPEAAFYWDQTAQDSSGTNTYDSRFAMDSFFSPPPSPDTASLWFNAVANHTP